MEENIIYDEELQHWGIKGQKWGVRKYQNKDGSLTPAGRKRYGSLTDAVGAVKAAHIKAKRKKQLAAARKVAAEKKAAADQRAKDVADGKISARKMTSEELQKQIDKLNLEKRYKQLMNETSPTADTVQAGKSFAKKMWDDAIQPSMINATKEVVGGMMKEAAKKQFGIKDDELTALKKTWDKMEYKEKISKAEKTIYDNKRKMNGEDDDKSPSIEDRKKIYESQHDILSEKEKERYKKQGWFDESKTKFGKESDTDNYDSSSSSSTNTDSESSKSTPSSSSDSSSSSGPVPGSNVPVKSKQFEFNEQVGIDTINELKDKYGRHILYMSDNNKDELYHNN